MSNWAKKVGAAIELQTFVSSEAFLFRYEEDKTFDILLLDIEMAEMDGVSLSRGCYEKLNRAMIEWF